MNKIVFILFISILSGCKYFDPHQLEEIKTYTFNDSLGKSHFTYYYYASNDERIADDEYEEWLDFEIDANVNEFTYKDSALKNINCIFSIACFMTPPFDTAARVKSYTDNTRARCYVTNGYIEGKKLNGNEWKIETNISYSERDTLSLDKVFEKDK